MEGAAGRAVALALRTREYASSVAEPAEPFHLPRSWTMDTELVQNTQRRGMKRGFLRLRPRHTQAGTGRAHAPGHDAHLESAHALSEPVGRGAESDAPDRARTGCEWPTEHFLSGASRYAASAGCGERRPDPRGRGTGAVS